jgi:thioredoxin-dependent peroxiredoxin
MLKEGGKAPEIRLQTADGKPFKLSDLKGRKVVLYFYPRADTPGCTVEACEFRDSAKQFAKNDTVIVGVSPDTTAAQAKFASKYGLPFTLLADPEKTAAEAYGVYKEKNMYGRKVMGIERTTFVIDSAGKIEKIYNKVKAKGHADQVLAALSE